jgi:hypothetical protein
MILIITVINITIYTEKSLVQSLMSTKFLKKLSASSLIIIKLSLLSIETMFELISSLFTIIVVQFLSK